MEERRHLHHPLLSPSTCAPAASPPIDDHVLNNLNLISSNPGIVIRLCLVALIGTVSIWANHEASKGYSITILNESAHTFAGTRFQLFYVSNDEATRLVVKASNIIENFLYQDSNSISSTKKPIKSVIVKLVGHNLTDNVVLESGSTHDQFVLNISPSIMGGKNFDRDLAVAILQGVVRIWLWDGQGKAPRNLINGIVEYMVNTFDGSSSSLYSHGSTAVCWDSDDRRAVAEFLKRGEHRQPGFIRRLNEAMKDGWDDEKLGRALGLPVHKSCGISESLMYNSSGV